MTGGNKHRDLTEILDRKDADFLIRAERKNDSYLYTLICEKSGCVNSLIEKGVLNFDLYNKEIFIERMGGDYNEKLDVVRGEN